jgi:hypothetical protein
MEGIAEVVHGTDGRILGIRVKREDVKQVLDDHTAWLEEHGLFLIADVGIVRTPCMRIIKSEDQAISTVWSDKGMEAVVIAKDFYQEQVSKTTFYSLLENIKKFYHSSIIIEGCRSQQELKLLQQCGVWGLVGYMYKPISTKKVQYLM